MYLLTISYTQAPDKVAAHVPSHKAWLEKGFKDGHFLFAGPKKSGLGGVIAAASMDKTALLALIAEDSYVREDVADYQVVDFDCTWAAPAFETLKRS